MSLESGCEFLVRTRNPQLSAARRLDPHGHETAGPSPSPSPSAESASERRAPSAERGARPSRRERHSRVRHGAEGPRALPPGSHPSQWRFGEESRGPQPSAERRARTLPARTSLSSAPRRGGTTPPRVAPLAVAFRRGESRPSTRARVRVRARARARVRGPSAERRARVRAPQRQKLSTGDSSTVFQSSALPLSSSLRHACRSAAVV